MCPYRVKIAQNDTLDRSSGVYEVLNDLFVDLLGVSIGRGSRFDGSILIDGILVGFSVDSTGGGENDTLHVMLGHQLQQVDQRNKVVAVVEQRFLYRLADGLAGSKMNDAVEGVLFKQSLHRAMIGTILLIEEGPFPGDASDTLQHTSSGVRKIINDNHFVPGLLQLNYGM